MAAARRLPRTRGGRVGPRRPAASRLQGGLLEHPGFRGSASAGICLPAPPAISHPHLDPLLAAPPQSCPGPLGCCHKAPQAECFQQQECSSVQSLGDRDQAPPDPASGPRPAASSLHAPAVGEGALVLPSLTRRGRILGTLSSQPHLSVVASRDPSSNSHRGVGAQHTLETTDGQ